MLIKTIHGWELPEHQATPEDIFWNRRQFVAALGLGAGTIALGGLGVMPARAAASDDPTADLYPAQHNEAYKIDRPVTEENLNLTYNNFYEFGSSKRISEAAQALPIRPWEVRIDGEVEKEFTIGIDELIRKVGIEERLYRHRCVEAWSMTIPWSGFAFSKLVDLAQPKSSAKFIRMETFKNPEVAPGQKPPTFPWQQALPWPYVEGMTVAEARNDLAFLVTGAYGKPVAKQMGAPLRLALPWKYGFKSIKSIVRFTFTNEQPVSFWEQLQPQEYGFWANVNPEVPHPRWSQATERVLGTGKRVPTLLYNGYGEQVAALYKGSSLPPEKLFR
ncbi:MAG: protein-methionine-sulfoxide reductase catalytic subunit MsrP [Hyphomicrobiales bacterium]